MDRKRVWTCVAALALIAGALLSCEVAPDAPAADRQQVLRDLVANVIVPTYQRLATDTAALSQSLTALRSAPSALALQGAQQQYRLARKTQKTSEAFKLGPADDLAVTGDTIDTWPADGAKIDGLLASANAVDTVTRLGANQRGFAALEYVLFDSTLDDAALLARFTSNPRRAQLAESMAVDLASKCKLLSDAMSGPSGYGQQLAEAGVSSTMFPAQSDAVDKIVTGMLYVVELMVTAKLAKPLGSDNNDVVQPQLEEGPRSDSSLADLQANLDGLQAIYTGMQEARVGKGIADAVREVNPAVDVRFTQSIADVRAAIGAVPTPFRVALVQDRAPLHAVYQSVRTLKTAVQTELAGALGASLGFGYSDTD
jgi:predicted lipoprotein